MQWYYAKDGEQYGPVDDTEFRRLAREGRILPDDLVWNQAQGEEWKPASSFSFLFLPPVDLLPPELPDGSESQDVTHQPGMLPNRDLMRRARESLKGHWAEGVLATLIYMAILVLPNFLAGLLSTHQTAHQISSPPQPSSPSLEGSLLQIIFGFLISPPLIVGFIFFILGLARRSKVEISQVFWGFRIFWKSVGTYLLVLIFSLLWVIISIIPVAAVVSVVLATIPHFSDDKEFSLHAVVTSAVVLAVLAYIFVLVKTLSYTLTYLVLADTPSVSPLEAIRISKQLMRGKKWKFICLVLRFFGWWFLALLTCGIGFLWLIPYIQTSFAHFYLDAKRESVKPIPAN